MPSEVAARADFSIIRYAQVWEDADVLLDALAIQPDDECLSIASAGDNALAMLARGPRRVVAVDLNPAQLACLILRVAAFRQLEHREILELIGSVASERRSALYARLRTHLPPDVCQFWDSRPELVHAGIGTGGKFENYFRIFRERVLPLVHSRATIEDLLKFRDIEQRKIFYDERWNTWRWRMLFRLFFSRTMMGSMGRDPSFFRYVEGSVADKILLRTHHALTGLDPSSNPYLQWILTGTHGALLPFYLRLENFDAIRQNLDRLEWHLGSIEDFLSGTKKGALSKFNLSDIFEYLSLENTHQLLKRIAASARKGGRLAYWNMLAPRSAGEALQDQLSNLPALSNRLHREDKAFFYSAFVVEEVR